MPGAHTKPPLNNARKLYNLYPVLFSSSNCPEAVRVKSTIQQNEEKQEAHSAQCFLRPELHVVWKLLAMDTLE